MNTGRQLAISASLSMAVKALDELSELISLFCYFCAAGLAQGWEDRNLFPGRPGSAWYFEKGHLGAAVTQISTSPSFSQNPGFVLSQATHSVGPHFPVSPRSALGAPTTLPLAGTGSEGLDCRGDFAGLKGDRTSFSSPSTPSQEAGNL